MSGAGMSFTTPAARLGGTEAWSTAGAAAISTALYVVLGEPYLARGVVGDLAGFAVLTGVLASSGRRARHEALVCLGLIGAVLVAQPDWPLRQGRAVWWTAVTVGLAGYLVVRTRVLRSRAQG